MTKAELWNFNDVHSEIAASMNIPKKAWCTRFEYIICHYHCSLHKQVVRLKGLEVVMEKAAAMIHEEKGYRLFTKVSLYETGCMLTAAYPYINTLREPSHLNQ